MRQTRTLLLISATAIVLGTGGWYALIAKDAWEPKASESFIPAGKGVTKGRAQPGPAPAASSAVGPAANRSVRVRYASGRTFIVEDFGQVPAGTIDKVMAALGPQALAGDATSSYGIFLKLNECANIVRRASRGAALQTAPNTAAACADLSAEDERSSSRWLSLAAEQGNIGARLLYATDSESALGGPAELLRDPDGVKDYKQRAVGYLEELASQGSVDALLRLGNAYHAGVLTGKDAVTSRAYFEAVRLSDPSVVPATQVSALDKALNANELSLAISKGNRIYDSCCR